MTGRYNINMPFEDEISKRLEKAPDIVVALFWALLMTGGSYVFIYFAKLLETLPKSFDLPWLLLFFSLFLLILVRRRVKLIRSDQKPTLS
jgi:hypothetical protein